MEYAQDDYLMLSGIQHFAFCRRQWAMDCDIKRRKKMLVLITYDVSTMDAEGKKRLRKVAEKCVDYGQRVQNSVFECILDASQLLLLKDMLKDIIDMEQDSLRFYYLGNQYKTKVEHFGKEQSYEADGVLML